jgi:hypothetical protein
MEAERHQKSKPPLASEMSVLLPHCFVVNIFPEGFSEVEQIAQV